MKDHDQLFKRLLKLCFPDLLGITVPDMAKRLDLDQARVFAQEVHRMTYVGFGLSRCPAEDFLDRPEPLAWALAALMRFNNRDRTEHKLACLRPIAHAELDEVKRFVLIDIVESYIELNPEEAKRYAARLASQTEDAEVRTMTLTWSEKIEAKGYERGIERGIEQGLRQMAQMLQHLLERRFGPLPPTALERLAAIRDASTLDQLGQRLLDARSLEELGLAA